MKKTILIILATTNLLFGQQTDTLVMNDIKFPLNKTKVFYQKTWGINVTLPSEYKAASKTYSVHYKCKDSWDYESSTDKDGNNYTVAVGSPDTCIKCRENDIMFNNFSSELNLTYLLGTSFHPYIKSGKNKYYFAGCMLIQLQNDTLSECRFDSDNVDFEFSGKYSKRTNLFFLKNITYRKGNSTFVLHHTFLIHRPNK